MKKNDGNDTIKLVNHFSTAEVGDRVACWVVQMDELHKPQILLRQGVVIGTLGAGAVLIQDEVLQGIEDPFYAGRDMIFEAGEA